MASLRPPIHYRTTSPIAERCIASGGTPTALSSSRRQNQRRSPSTSRAHCEDGRVNASQTRRYDVACFQAEVLKKLRPLAEYRSARLPRHKGVRPLEPPKVDARQRDGRHRSRFGRTRRGTGWRSSGGCATTFRIRTSSCHSPTLGPGSKSMMTASLASLFALTPSEHAAAAAVQSAAGSLTTDLRVGRQFRQFANEPRIRVVDG